MGTFGAKIPSDLRHIVAKKTLAALFAGGPLTYVLLCQVVLIFA